MKGTILVGMTVAVALVISLTGCTAKLSAAKMCAAAGGTYSMQSQTCDTPAQSGRKASEMCAAHNGYYDPTAQSCEVGRGQ